MDGWETTFILGRPIFRCHVSWPEGKAVLGVGFFLSRIHTAYFSVRIPPFLVPTKCLVMDLFSRENGPRLDDPAIYSDLSPKGRVVSESFPNWPYSELPRWIPKIAIFERRYTLKEPSFSVSMLDFAGCTEQSFEDVSIIKKTAIFQPVMLVFWGGTPIWSRKSGWKETFPFELALFWRDMLVFGGACFSLVENHKRFPTKNHDNTDGEWHLHISHTYSVIFSLYGTLQETNISPKNGIFEDYFPFPQVGYVNFLEGTPLLWKRGHYNGVLLVVGWETSKTRRKLQTGTNHSRLLERLGRCAPWGVGGWCLNIWAMKKGPLVG